MILEELIAEANNLADDMLPDDEVVGFVNDAISAINIEVDADFPMVSELEDEPVIPDKWQRMLIIPYVKGRIKEKDSSQFEWEVAYEQFFTNLEQFKKYYEVPEEFRKDKRTDLIKIIDALSEQRFSVEDLISFINDGIAEINSKLNAVFPFIDKDNITPEIPETWQRSLLVHYANSRIKDRIGSPNESELAYNRFLENLTSFDKFYDIPVEYQKDPKTDLVRHILTLSNNRLTSEDVVGFINDAISAVNIEVSADFPFIDGVSDDTVLPSSWERMLVVPYAKARIKERENAPREWEIAYNQFNSNLERFKQTYVVPKEYQMYEFSDIVNSILVLANNYINPSDVVDYINDAISTINVEVRANFPLIESPMDEIELPETWQRILIIPFAKGRMKEQNSSQFEWEAGYSEFYENLNTFKLRYVVPDKYKNNDDIGDISTKSFTQNVPFIWGGW